MAEQRRPPTAEPPPDAAKGDGRTVPTPTGAPGPQPPGEVGGPKGPEPTRYGDWEKGGRCTDF